MKYNLRLGERLMTVPWVYFVGKWRPFNCFFSPGNRW